LDRYRIGIVGAGNIVETMHLPVLLNLPEARVVWLADADEDRARAVARAFGVRAVGLPRGPSDVPESDVVLLAVHVGARPLYFEAFARRGVAVFAEKPFARTVAEHARLLGLFPEHRLGCGYMRRTYATTAFLRRAVRGKWFGPLRRIRIAEGGRVTKTGRSRTPYDDPSVAGGGVLMDLGTHSVDLALYLLGASTVEVHGAQIVWDGALDRKVTGELEVPFETGIVTIEVCVSWLDRQPNRIELEFPAVSLSAPNDPEPRIEFRRPGCEEAQATMEVSGLGARTSYQAFFLEWRSFLEGLRTGSASLVSAASALPTTTAIEGLYRAGARS